MAARTFYLDARSASWNSVCDAILRFNAWREHNSGYFYVRSRPDLRGEIAKLCSHLDLDEAYCFADDGATAGEGAAWIDVSQDWEPPQQG